MARLSAFIGAIAVADLVKTTLGPRGMDKILQSASDAKPTFTNDGATILRSIPIDNPAAKIIVDTSKTQDKEVGDGTTSVAVLAGELLREAELLIAKKIHPQTIIRGWRKAVKVALAELESSAVDNSADSKLFREDLVDIGRTTLSSKILAPCKDYFSELAVSAVMRVQADSVTGNFSVTGDASVPPLEPSVEAAPAPAQKKKGKKKKGKKKSSKKEAKKEAAPATAPAAAVTSANASDFLGQKDVVDLSMIQIIKKSGGTLLDSYLEEGFILNKRFGIGQAKVIENARILVANTPMDTDKIKILGARVRTSSVAKVAEVEAIERKKMSTKVEKILKHDINCFINRQLIYNLPEQMFTAAGVTSIEHADFEGVERLAKVLDAEVVSTFDNPDRVKIGRCDKIDEIMIGEDKMIRFSGVAGGAACSIVLRGASQSVLDEAERSLHDALAVLSQTLINRKTVLGGGSSEMRMAYEVDKLALTLPGKEALAVESFARALRMIPTIIADNAGLDSNELLTQLRSAHYEKKNPSYGVDVITGGVGDMRKLRITESLKCKRQVLLSAHEAAEMIVRVDQIIRCAPRERKQRMRR